MVIPLSGKDRISGYFIERFRAVGHLKNITETPYQASVDKMAEN